LLGEIQNSRAERRLSLSSDANLAYDPSLVSRLSHHIPPIPSPILSYPTLPEQSHKHSVDSFYAESRIS